MTTRDMAYIVSIAEEQSITRAAAKMYMAQPALSQCVQKVEKELGVTIFHRQPNGVKLTAEGECFLEFAKKTLTEQKTMEKKLLDLQNSDRVLFSLVLRECRPCMFFHIFCRSSRKSTLPLTLS